MQRNSADAAGDFESAAAVALVEVPEFAMLTPGIASAYRDGIQALIKHPNVRIVHWHEAKGLIARQALLVVIAEEFIANPDLVRETSLTLA